MKLEDTKIYSFVGMYRVGLRVKAHNLEEARKRLFPFTFGSYLNQELNKLIGEPFVIYHETEAIDEWREGKDMLPGEQDQLKSDYLAQKAGLKIWGLNEEGDVEYVGTDKQWQKFRDLKQEWIDGNMDINENNKDDNF